MGSGGSKKLAEQDPNARAQPPANGSGGGGGGDAVAPKQDLSSLDEATRKKIEEAVINKRHTMLLLGTAGVGKSTISKQFVIAFGDGMTPEQIKAGANQVLQNLAQKISQRHRPFLQCVMFPCFLVPLITCFLMIHRP